MALKDVKIMETPEGPPKEPGSFWSFWKVWKPGSLWRLLEAPGTFHCQTALEVLGGLGVWALVRAIFMGFRVIQYRA